ncbi:MAG TPA: hypothetical protein VKS21_03290, partial [Spirochaetota bacterium]|nr:hypothetical protein [Spirochaetota bacterium]
IGTCIRLTNRFHASAYKPFGFDLKRTYLNFNFINNENADRSQAEATIWLIENTNIITNSWIKYLNMFMIFDNVNEKEGAISRFGYYKGTPSVYSLQNCTDALGEPVDLTGGSQPLNHDFVDNNFSPGTPNTNHYIFRITHDGQKITVYINPDPDNNEPLLPNEFCRVMQTPVSWNSNLMLMFGHESRSIRREIDVDYDYLLVRSAAAGATGRLDYDREEGKLNAGISAVINKKNSGINLLKIVFAKNSGPVLLSGVSLAVDNNPYKLSRLKERPYRGKLTMSAAGGIWYMQKSILTLILNDFAGKKTLSAAKQNLVRFKLELKIKPQTRIKKQPAVYIAGEQFDFL